LRISYRLYTFISAYPYVGLSDLLRYFNRFTNLDFNLRFVRSLCLLALLGCHCWAYAHPHLRLSYRLSPVLANGVITAVQVSWQIDAMNGQLIRQNIDLNENGVLDEEELQQFAATNQALMQPFQFFLTIENGTTAQPVPFSVRQFSTRDGGKGFQGGIFWEFTAELDTSQPLQSLQLQMQDPTWYIGFEPLMGKALASASDCESNFTREKRLTPSQGEQEVQRIFIQCASVSAAQPNAQLSPQIEPTHGDPS
jgi:ABC-type uncharacterized transport system substrate-binding protein